MPTILPSPPILDSSGQLADGFIRVAASRAFDSARGHVTTAWSTARVNDGVATQHGAPWFLQPTPDGVWLNLEQDLDGEKVIKYQVIVPDREVISYSDLLFNRGGIGAGWETFWWDLTGLGDFPPEAINNDMGIDFETGDVFRNVED